MKIFDFRSTDGSSIEIHGRRGYPLAIRITPSAANAFLDREASFDLPVGPAANMIEALRLWIFEPTKLSESGSDLDQLLHRSHRQTLGRQGTMVCELCGRIVAVTQLGVVGVTLAGTRVCRANVGSGDPASTVASVAGTPGAEAMRAFDEAREAFIKAIESVYGS